MIDEQRNIGFLLSGRSRILDEAALDLNLTSSGTLFAGKATEQILTRTWLFLTGVGIGATAIMDVWTLIRRRVFGTPLPNYALVGRWLGRMMHGEFRQQSMARAVPVRGEMFIGWAAHYLIGIAFAALIPIFWGYAWLNQPTLLPALLIGLGTVLAPLFVMQPAMGAGIASSRMPRPGAARLQSIVSHGCFGLGLYASALIISIL
jgi:hypothetical protein